MRYAEIIDSSIVALFTARTAHFELIAEPCYSPVAVLG
jgi:hypothetical protein